MVISDAKLIVDSDASNNVSSNDNFVPEVRSYVGYMPFGMEMPTRKYTSGTSYRYGYNGKEKDQETLLQDYGARILDNRIGKFLSTDPLKSQYAALTPYQFASNTPIVAVDRDGEELELYESNLETIAYLKTGNSEELAERRYKEGMGALILVVGTADMLITKGWIGRTWGFYTLGEAAGNSEKAFEAKKRGDKWGFEYYSKKSKQAFGELTFVAVGYVAGKVISYGFDMYAKRMATGLSDKAKLLTSKSEVDVVYADDEGMRYLESQNAEATYFSTGDNEGFMLVKPGASRPVVLEEIIHHNQKIQHGEKYFLENQAKLEVEAQEVLLEIGKKEGWSGSEMEKIQHAKGEWKKKAEVN